MAAAVNWSEEFLLANAKKEEPKNKTKMPHSRS
jgi:hypothetical protein